MILVFADVHLGIKSYSSYNSKGLSTAENEARASLEEIYLRASKTDISMICCLGDFFHTNQPSTENISFAISWFHKMDSLNKPFFVIPGNHDAAMYSNSLIFLNSLKLENTKLLIKKEGFDFSYIWKNWNLKFIPYSYSDTMKNKEDSLYSEVENTIMSSSEKTIIFSHIQETTAKLGSEAIMISKGVDILNLDNIHHTKDIFLISGHIHRHQIYKKGFMTVCYTGNTFYQDASDCNQPKGYITINELGDIKFEKLRTIRKFISFYIPKNIDYLELISSRRIEENSVIFLSLEQEKDIQVQDKIVALLTRKNCILGNIKWEQSEESINTSKFKFEHTDPYKIFEESISSNEDLTSSFKKDVLSKGFFYLDQTTGSSK
jgi:DNA repair exonuclease SbcCD nuclease subunit